MVVRLDDEAPRHPPPRPGPVPARPEVRSATCRGATGSRSTCRRSRRSRRWTSSAPVTLLAGDNGTGKSTLIEAFAAAIGFAPEGGELERSGELPPVPRPVLGGELEPVLERWSKPAQRLLPARRELLQRRRASSTARARSRPTSRSTAASPLHQQSHGESFLALATNRFAGEGLYILDEPEAALSVTGALAVLAAIVRAAGARRAVHHRHPLADPARLPGRPHLRARRGRLPRERVRRPRRRPPHPRLPRRPRALPPGRARLSSRSTASAACRRAAVARTSSRSSRARGAHVRRRCDRLAHVALAQLDARADRLELGGVGELVDGLRDRDGRDAEPQRLGGPAHAGVGDEHVGVREHVELRLRARGLDAAGQRSPDRPCRSRARAGSRRRARSRSARRARRGRCRRCRTRRRRAGGRRRAPASSPPCGSRRCTARRTRSARSRAPRWAGSRAGSAPRTPRAGRGSRRRRARSRSASSQARSVAK